MSENRETRWPMADGQSLEPVAAVDVLDELLHPDTGELLPATPDNAATVRVAAHARIKWLEALKRACDAILAEEARRLGTATFSLENHQVVMSAGKTTKYRPLEVMENLRKEGCPEERISEAVVQIVDYKVDGRVLRQLKAANERYAVAIEVASYEVEERRRATVK